MNRKKCARCGLVNSDLDERCRRCGSSLVPGAPAVDDSVEAPKKRSLLKRLIWIGTTTLLLLFLIYLSLLITSDAVPLSNRETINKAIALLKEKGFDREVFVLELSNYRSNDNWWNSLIGHRDAYAATNFPFEIVTVYPEFFHDSIDDTERAAILLHEAYHLRGSGEEAALEGVWQEKKRLGWTSDRYSYSKIWNHTRELTVVHVPHLFRCGPEGKSDCTESP